jgi:hypothetical protein
MYNATGTRQLSAFTTRAMIRIPGLRLDAWPDPAAEAAPLPVDDDAAAPTSPLER